MTHFTDSSQPVYYVEIEDIRFGHDKDLHKMGQSMRTLCDQFTVEPKGTEILARFLPNFGQSDHFCAKI